MSEKPLSILHIISSSKWTGPAVPAGNIARIQGEKGHLVGFACVEGKSLEKRMRRYPLAVITTVDLRTKVGPIAALWQAKYLRSCLRKRPFDVVHVHLTHDNFLAAFALRKIDLPVPLVRTQHSCEPPKMGITYKYLFRRCNDLVITVSRKSMNEYNKAYDLPNKRTAVIRGSVSLTRFSPEHEGSEIRREFGIPSGALVLGMVSRMKEGRGHETVIRAFSETTKSVKDLHLLLVGEGEKENTLRGLAGNLGIAERVHFLGHRDEDLPEVYGTMDAMVYLRPGSDGSCRAVKECMASGRPVLGGPEGAVPELVEEGKTGMVLETEEHEELTTKMLSFCGDRDRLGEMGRSARSFAEREFSEDREYNETIEAYRSALDARIRR